METWFLVDSNNNSVIDRCTADSWGTAATHFENKHGMMADTEVVSETDYLGEWQLIKMENQPTEQ